MKNLISMMVLSVLIILTPIANSQDYKINMSLEAVNNSLQFGEVVPLGPVFAEEEWITFANNHCDVNITDVSQLATAELHCYHNDVNDSNVPSSGFGKHANYIIVYLSEHTHLDFLSGLETVDNFINSHYSSITNVDGLSSLVSVRSLGFNNSNLQNINGLSSLRTVVHGINVAFNPSLNDLSPLNGITFLGTGVTVNTNKNYQVKMSASSYICANNKFDRWTTKAYICET
jgi:hypothetical protein